MKKGLGFVPLLSELCPDWHPHRALTVKLFAQRCVSADLRRGSGETRALQRVPTPPLLGPPPRFPSVLHAARPPLYSGN